MTARACAIKAMVEPNLGKRGSRTGPRNSDTMKRAKSTAPFQTRGPKETTAMRTKAAGGCVPLVPGNDLTNKYAIMNSTAMKIGKITSEMITARQPARGTSPDIFSEGWPSTFFLYPVILVLDRRQYPIQELLCDREFPLDIHLKNSLKMISEYGNINNDEGAIIPIVDYEIGEGKLMRIE